MDRARGIFFNLLNWQGFKKLATPLEMGALELDGSVHLCIFYHRQFFLLYNKSPKIYQLKIACIYYLRVLWVRSPGGTSLVQGLQGCKKCRHSQDWDQLRPGVFIKAPEMTDRIHFIATADSWWLASPRPDRLCFLDLLLKSLPDWVRFSNEANLPFD